MKLTALLLITAAFSTVPRPNAPRFEKAYVRVDVHNSERLVPIGHMPTTPSPYLLTVYIWDNRTTQYVSRQVYTQDGITQFTGSTTYPIVIPRAGSGDGAELQ